MSKILLSREEFRTAVFKRDGNKCVFCGNPPTAAHHIVEKRLWGDGGYYVDNGASVCDPCHIKCETTEYSVEQVREACGITNIILPEHLYNDVEQPIDKWGNIILSDGRRLRGELFFDESVQKILARGNKLDLFTKYYKHPRTHHLPWSESLNKDDRMISSMDAFTAQRVIVTQKMDGENTTLYNDYIHARSLDNKRHASRDWVKQFHASICADIPEGWRVCGENCYAKHSIKYTDLPSYFLGFSVWNELNECLSWDETLEWFTLLGITPVPVIYDGIYDEAVIKSLWNPAEWATNEGYVMRTAEGFPYREFKTRIGKYVRHSHVQTIKHWMFGQVMEKNELL